MNNQETPENVTEVENKEPTNDDPYKHLLEGFTCQECNARFPGRSRPFVVKDRHSEKRRVGYIECLEYKIDGKDSPSLRIVVQDPCGCKSFLLPENVVRYGELSGIDTEDKIAIFKEAAKMLDEEAEAMKSGHQFRPISAYRV